jgi:chromosome segregation ATPase
VSEDRLEELMRVNAELAAEIRSLTAGRTDVARARQAPAARGIARILGERDSLSAELEARVAELEGTRAELRTTQLHREGLERQNQEMARELARLSTGFAGILRRTRGRLLSR